MGDSKRSKGNETNAKEAILTTASRGSLILTVILLSGCLIRPTPRDPSAGLAAGQTRSVIYVPVLILPPSDNDQEDDRDESSDPRPIPPVEIVRDQQKMARPQGCQIVTRRLQPPTTRHATDAAGTYKAKAKPES